MIAAYKNPHLVKRDSKGRYRTLQGKFADLRLMAEKCTSWRVAHGLPKIQDSFRLRSGNRAENRQVQNVESSCSKIREITP